MPKLALSIALGATAAFVPLLVAMQSVVADSPDSQAFGQIQNGRYLAIAADCAACHTVPDTGKPFAGGRAIETPFGNIVAPNITPDRDTGIGAWTDDEFDDAVRRGIRPNGARLYPAMPYTAYTKMSRADVLAIRAYLKTVAPVQNQVVANTLPFPFNIRAAMRVWDALYFTAGEFAPDPQRSAEWNRGAFLVQGPAHCGACHTPKSFLGGDKTSEYLRGANLQGWFAPDITNDARTGLGRWSAGDITTYLKSGHNRMTAATGPMAEMIADSTSQMTGSDLAAIAAYLKSLPGRDDNPTPVGANDPFMVAGQAIYRDQCSACHALDGKGVPQLFPSLVELFAGALERSGHIDPRRSSRCAQRRDGGRAHRAGNAVVRLATRRCTGRGGADLYPQHGRRRSGACFTRRRQPCTVGAAGTDGLAQHAHAARPGPLICRAPATDDSARRLLRRRSGSPSGSRLSTSAWVRSQNGVARASRRRPAGVSVIRRPRLSSGSAVTTTRPRRSNGLSAAVSVVRSMASSDATDAIPAGFGRFSDIMSENCPLVRPSGRRTSSKRRASARAACWTWRQRHVSRTRSVVS